MKLVRFFSALLFLTLPFSSNANAATTFTGRVVGVSDGDTMEVMKGRRAVKIRLYGIDCPEKSQPFGQRAKQFTSSFAFGKTARVESKEKDQYNRFVAEVFVDNKSLNAALVENGLAWAYRHYTTKFVPLEEQARQAKRGLWADPNPTPPWEFRRNPPKNFQHLSQRCRDWLRFFRALLKETR
ncbi:MAG: thermonuclease family protein [bacterium]